MSRLARKPVEVPKGVEINYSADKFTVKGSKGELSLTVHDSVLVKVEDGHVNFQQDNPKPAHVAMLGTTCKLIQNMMHGVSEGWTKKLLLVGVGYRAKVAGSNLEMTLGFSHPVKFPIPDNISITTPTQTEIVVEGVDRQLVGQVAANIRRWRPVESYKGKGVRYADEQVSLKETKKK